METETGGRCKVIPIRNIYYMLSYAFQVLQEQGYRSLGTEEFANTADLCAAILCRGTSSQLKQGLGRSYISQTESMASVRGRIELTESICNRVKSKMQLVCTYDDFSENSRMNRILKSTLLLLSKYDIGTERRKEIRQLLVFFREVDEIDLLGVDWHMRYDRNNQTYRMLMAVCWLVVKGLLQRQTDGTMKMMHFLDEKKMCRLYEKFILNYYRREHTDINAEASQIDWQLDDGEEGMLPVMQTDITLSDKAQTRFLIMDAKFYEHSLQTRYDTVTLHSANLYQIFTYVKNKEYALKDVFHTVSGMLLYARTDEETVPNEVYQMSGNRISVKTLDLNREFEEIAKQLDDIYAEFFADNDCQ